MCRLLPLVLLLLARIAVAQGDGVSPYAAGLAALDVADYGEATRRLAEAVTRAPRHADAHYALALAYAADSPLRDEREVVRHLEAALRLDPDNARYLEARLASLRRTLGEAASFSTTDTRRPALARRILALDSASALAHEELGLSVLLEFGWRRQLADQRGGWDPAAARGLSGTANRARSRAEAHLGAALRSEPARASVHRLRLRLAAEAHDDLRLAEAARAFAAARPDDPAALLYLGLAAYRTNDRAEAERRFEQSLTATPPDERASFERIVLLLDEEERRAFAADSAAATAQFWRTRDPQLLSPQNERRLEHVARLALADLLFAGPREGTRGWDTPQGEVVVRYGLPDADGRWLTDNVIAKDFGAYERWVYAGDDGFSLLFEDDFRSGAFDFQSSAAGEDEATRARSLFRRMPERFHYEPPGGLVPFPYLTSTFKGQDGQTDVIVSLGVPLDPGAGDSSLLGLDTGAFLLGPDATVTAGARRHVQRLRAEDTVRRDSALLWAGGLMLSAAPGAYTLAVEFEQPQTGATGIHREALTLPDYDAPGLRISSVLPALLVEESEGAVAPGRVRRGPLVIEPAPWGEFSLGAALYLYVEAYGLALRSGRTRYEIEAVLSPEDRAGALVRLARRLFGRASPSGVSVRYAVSGRTADEGQYALLDASGQPPGGYLLTLRIHDLHAGTTAEATRRIALTPAESAPPR